MNTVWMIFGNKVVFNVSNTLLPCTYKLQADKQTSSGNDDVKQALFGSPLCYPFLTLLHLLFG